jgi:zinc finger FYVE domain-containing protein 26
VQVIQDELLSKEIEMYRSLDDNQISPPLELFQRYLVELKSDTDGYDKTSSLNMAVSSCMRDMYHYGRVSGLHILDRVMESALSAVKREQLQEASNVCVQFYV